MKQKLLLLQGEIEKPIIILKYFISSFSITHSICRLTISKDREDVQQHNQQIDLTFKYHSTDQEQSTEFFPTVNEWQMSWNYLPRQTIFSVLFFFF